jgi:hypothetical protein
MKARPAILESGAPKRDPGTLTMLSTANVDVNHQKETRVLLRCYQLLKLIPPITKRR